MKKFKRLIAIVTVLLFALSIIAPALAQDETTTTTDQTSSSVYDDAAKILKDKGIMVGNESGDLMLDKSLTRAEILKMIILSTGQGDVVQDYVYAEQSFKDVPNTHWAFAYVEAGKDLGIVNGYPNGTFKPDQPVKFEELCKMLVAAKGESPASGKWPVNYVRKALDLGYFTGVEDEVGIGDVVIRGQAAVAFANAFFPPEKTITVKSVKALANDSIQVAVDVYLNGEPATLEDGDIMPMDFTIKDASDATKTLAVTAIDSNASDFANGIVVLKTAAQTAGANYKVFFKDQDTNLTFAGVALPLQVTKVEALNYKEIKVTFNRAVDNATYATTTGNYTVKIGTATTSVSNVDLAADKTSAILLLADNFSNNDTVTVTVSKNVGMAQDYTTTISNFIDTTAPVVENVVGSGLMKVVVTFSEPVQGADNPANYLIDNAYTAAQVSADSTGKIYTITLYGPLSAGNHTVQFTNIKDYANYGLVTPIKTFALQADNTPISLPSVISATQTEVKLKFNKDIASVYNVSASPQGTFQSASYDGNIVTLDFGDDTTTALPASGATIKFDVTDASGITASGMTVTVIPTVDVTRPAFVTYTVNSTNEIVITYSKDVRINQPNESYQLKKSDGTIYVPTVDYAESGVYNKVKLTFSGLSEGTTYTLSISGVVDKTPLRNQIIPTDVSISIVDKTAPTPSYVYAVPVSGSDSRAAAIYVVFSEAVTATTATNPNNYTLTYVGGSSSSVASISSAYLTLLADNKTVKIDFRTNPQANVNNILVANVSDLAGNVLSGSYQPVASASTTTTSTRPTVTAAKLTSKTTVQITITGNMLRSIAPSDFLVRYVDQNGNKQTWAYITKVSTDSFTANNVNPEASTTLLTLTLNREVNTDGTIKVNDSYTTDALFELNPNGVVTTDVFGNVLLVPTPITSIALSGANDQCKPLITGVSAGDKAGTIKITFSENMISSVSFPVTFTPSSAVVLYKDNAKVNYTAAVWADAKTLIIGTNNPANTGELGGVYTVVIDAAQFSDVAPTPNVMAYVDPYTGIYVSNVAPTVSSIVAGSTAGTIEITFSEPVPTVDSGWLTVSGVTSPTVTWDAQKKVATITGLTSSQQYTVTVDLTKVRDSAGLAGSGSFSQNVTVN